MISSHRIPPIARLYIFIGSIQQVRYLGRGTDKKKKEAKNNTERRGRNQISDVPHANSSMFFFLIQSLLLDFT